MTILEILSYKTYYCIAAMIKAVRDDNYTYLIKIFGENEAINILKNIDQHIIIIKERPNEIKYYPIPLFYSDKTIYKNHFQVAASILCSLKDLPVIYKKIGTSENLKYESLDQEDKLDLGIVLSSII